MKTQITNKFDRACGIVATIDEQKYNGYSPTPEYLAEAEEAIAVLENSELESTREVAAQCREVLSRPITPRHFE